MTATAVETRTHLVEVEFKGNRRAFYTWTGEAPPAARAAVIVQVERGEDLGRIHSTGELAEKRKEGTSHGKASPGELPKAVRLATSHEIDTAVRLRVDEESVRKAALELVRQMNLDMKVSDAEWQWDRRRLTCYFTAEERVDFRQLVRQLEKRFSTRVHMWHIGVRDEARRLDGVGRCGRQFCSASWLPELRPVKSSSAKDQRLSTLNPSQISGTCGRLMCCLRYEHEFYVHSRKRFPKEGKIVTTTVGEEKIVSNDIFRDLVTLRTATGEARTIPLLQLRRELGDTTIPVDDEPHHDEEPNEGHDSHHDAHEELEKREDRGRASGRGDREASETRSRESVREPREPRERATRDKVRPDRGPRDLVPLTRAAAPVAPAAPASPTPPAPPAPPAPPVAAPASVTPPGDTLDDAGDAGDDDAPESAASAEPGTADGTVDGTVDDSADAKKRGRRRRGRRGGRRGRSGDGKPGSPPAA